MDAQTATIEVQGTVYGLRFGYASFKVLCKLWGKEDIVEIFSCLGSLGDVGNGTLKLDMIETLADLVLACIIAADKDAAHELDTETVADVLFYDLPKAMEVLTLFKDSLPKMAPASKKKAVNKTPAKKKRKK